MLELFSGKTDKATQCIALVVSLMLHGLLLLACAWTPSRSLSGQRRFWHTVGNSAYESIVFHDVRVVETSTQPIIPDNRIPDELMAFLLEAEQPKLSKKEEVPPAVPIASIEKPKLSEKVKIVSPEPKVQSNDKPKAKKSSKPKKTPEPKVLPAIKAVAPVPSPALVVPATTAKSVEIAQSKTSKPASQGPIEKAIPQSVVPAALKADKVLPQKRSKESVEEKPKASSSVQATQQQVVVMPKSPLASKSLVTSTLKTGKPTSTAVSMSVGSSMVSDIFTIECNDEHNDHYQEEEELEGALLMEKISELISQQWEPLAGWEDAGPVVIKVAPRKLLFTAQYEPELLEKSRSIAKNQQALNIVRSLVASGVIAGYTFNLTFK